MIDTHCHIDDPVYQENLPAFLAVQQEGGVEAILVPGVNAASNEPVWSVCERYPGYLYPAIGLHPEEVKEDYREVLDAMEKVLDARQKGEGMHYIAVGEIGLDYHFDVTYKLEQKAAFRRQLEWAQRYDLPVMVHSRDATEDTLEILRFTINNLQFPNALKGVMHCFSGSNEVARQIVDMGLYLGIGGVITFKNCKLRDNLAGIPLERIVLETDAPYMAPVPFRGQPNESRYMKYVVDVLEQVYGVSFEEVEKCTTANARRLFGLNMQKK